MLRQETEEMTVTAIAGFKSTLTTMEDTINM